MTDQPFHCVILSVRLISENYLSFVENEKLVLTNYANCAKSEMAHMQYLLHLNVAGAFSNPKGITLNMELHKCIRSQYRYLYDVGTQLWV